MPTTTNDPEAFATGRLDLVPLRAAHAQEMARVLSDPALHTFIGGSPATADELRARYARQCAGSPDPAVTWWNWVIRLRTEGVAAGTVQATLSGPVAEIAWVVGTEWQGRGIASEAAVGLVALVGEVPGVRTVIAHIHPDHVASAGVARAAGLRPTGEWQDGEERWRVSPLGVPPAPGLFPAGG
ncbi:GNAT family N-acetyltransferase [Streptomyces sp. NBC_00388]|uniref:GNAT family N-acetyltransferase n=1 Tax=Streptomyces sp. NBC_00388 TaxID=2975735 RepID=UPI002E211B5A